MDGLTVLLYKDAATQLILCCTRLAISALAACDVCLPQVRFAFDLLCALQPGTSVMALHGKCKHAKRTQIYLDFIRKPGAVLLATDIAARGLDFPSVDWVIQVREGGNTHDRNELHHCL